jgi:hypothetical protein
MLCCGTARLNVTDRTTIDERATTYNSVDALATLSLWLVCAAIAPQKKTKTSTHNRKDRLPVCMLRAYEPHQLSAPH